ncbi:DUF4041 domain-containing protein [Bdellovibrio sp. 22V]|uniref:DUF4041 domain-containing protein n=1 Tax=Bdellovibrio sp. 22V TaxID=3044166 RepID=UPI0025435266|nr:DUF4041 domain-containing protein [Bdellovibrio sp. 22V]WII72348.1 DUF4041 domain-containing protein [Bdellovibrio sp. 22V]
MLVLGLTALLSYTAFLFFKKKRELSSVRNENSLLREQNSTIFSTAEKLTSEKKVLEEKLSQLSRYQEIQDVESHIEELRTKAETEIFELRQREDSRIKNEQHALFLLSTKAKEEADSIVTSAKESTKQVQLRNNQILADANNNAKLIIERANQEARKIASDALDAKDKAESYERTAIAMKNIIEGYGDRFLIPTFSLIDGLAEDYSHTDAGNELKRAREMTRAMIKNDTAATCEYVETNRKETAINFVLDAFNGKVDTILSTVKKDNYGTLQQRIHDAFQTVNFNGRAFRDAKITDLYLTARLEELKWACTVQALKDRDKEEQRRIREQIREEEKAARDYEKAIKEAQKEEETLSKAMDKARQDLESASEKQRIKYEEKLRELELKLKETEEKNQRALSMAQQTKTGHVYIISNVGSFGEEVIKIGLTRRLDPQDRIDELGDASVPFDFDVHAMILNEDAPALEKELHRRFSSHQVNRVNPRKEFFKVKIAELRKVIEEMGISVHWTMTAEAKEYRESLAISQREPKKAA